MDHHRGVGAGADRYYFQHAVRKPQHSSAGSTDRQEHWHASGRGRRRKSEPGVYRRDVAHFPHYAAGSPWRDLHELKGAGRRLPVAACGAAVVPRSRTRQ